MNCFINTGGYNNRLKKLEICVMFYFPAFWSMSELGVELMIR